MVNEEVKVGKSPNSGSSYNPQEPDADATNKPDPNKGNVDANSARYHQPMIKNATEVSLGLS